MAEPFFLCVEARFSQKNFKNWLSTPLELNGVSNGLVVDCLANFLADFCDGVSQNYLLCRYEKSTKALQFAIHIYDGSTQIPERFIDEVILSIDRAAGDGRGAKIHVWPAEAIKLSLLENVIHCNDEPVWLMEWLNNLSSFSQASSQANWIDHSILQRLADLNRIASASPENPIHIGWLYTDGVAVYAHVSGKTILHDDPAAQHGYSMEFTEPVLYVLEGANPKKMRVLSDNYYSDGNFLWHCNVMSGNSPIVLGTCEDHVPRVFKFAQDDFWDALIVMGNKAWSEACDDTKPTHERLFVKTVEVDGPSFHRVSNGIYFEDQFRRYCIDERLGLSVVDNVAESP